VGVHLPDFFFFFGGMFFVPLGPVISFLVQNHHMLGRINICFRATFFVLDSGKSLCFVAWGF